MLLGKINYIAFGLLLISICFSFKTDEVRSCPSSNNDLYDSIFPEKINSIIRPNCSEKELKSLVKNILVKHTGDPINIDDIESAKFWGTLKVNNGHNVEIFNIKLSYKLPAVYDYFGVLVIDNTELNSYFLFLNSIEPIKTRNIDSVMFFAGRYKRKGHGVFKIFSFKDDKLQSIFTTDEYVSNFSLDCTSYENEDLKLENVDLNNDSLLDLRFSGIKNYYCEGLEEGYSREDRKPLKKEKVTILYHYDKYLSNWKK